MGDEKEKWKVDLFDKFISNFKGDLLDKVVANLKYIPPNLGKQIHTYAEFFKNLDLKPENLIKNAKALEAQIALTLESIEVLKSLKRENRIGIRLNYLPSDLDPKERLFCYYQILATDGAYGDLQRLSGEDPFCIPAPEELGNYRVFEKIADLGTELCLWILEPKNHQSPPILLFRGTAHHRNWAQNLSPEIGKPGFDLLENRILQSIDKLYTHTQPHRVPPVIAGHSLGGVLSQRVLLSLLKNRPEYLWNPEMQQRAHVYLFASPGIGAGRIDYDCLVKDLEHPPFIFHTFEEVDVVPLTGGQTLPLDRAVVMTTYEKWNTVGAHISLPYPYALTEGTDKRSLIKGIDDEALKSIEQRGLLQESLRSIVVLLKTALENRSF